MEDKVSGFDIFSRIKRLENNLNGLGFVICSAPFSTKDYVSIKPKDDDSLPIFSRDAKPFTGTLEDLEQWVSGVIWARDYDRMLFGKNHDTKRERQEQNILNERVVKALKGEKS